MAWNNAIIILMVIIAQTLNYEVDGKCYKDVSLRPIPPTHLFHKLKQPLVIGYAGYIQKFQENTLDAMIELVNVKADGMHMQVQLTKDNKVILYAYENLEALTGERFKAENLPFSEIAKMRVMQNLKYSSNDNKVSTTRRYQKIEPIPLLNDVLAEVKGSGLLIYIELMPGIVASANAGERQISMDLAREVSSLISKHNMYDEVLVVSQDAFKLSFINRFDSKISHGLFTNVSMFETYLANRVKKYYNDIPGIYVDNCFGVQYTKNASGLQFAKDILDSGIVSKAINASFIEFAPDMYARPNNYFTSNIKDVIKRKYSSSTSIGYYSLFGLYEQDPNTADSHSKDESLVKSLVDKGVSRIITTDVNRVKRALSRAQTGEGAVLKSYVSVVLLTIVLGKALVTIFYL